MLISSLMVESDSTAVLALAVPLLFIRATGMLHTPQLLFIRATDMLHTLQRQSNLLYKGD
jgi:hypothetical protein